MADVLADKIVPRDGDNMVAADVIQAMQHVGHAPGNRGLAGAGIAGEAHVQRRRVGADAKAPPRRLDEQERGDLADAGLDGLQADEVVIEPREHVADRRLVVERGEIDAVGRRGFLDRLRLAHGCPCLVGEASSVSRKREK